MPEGINDLAGRDAKPDDVLEFWFAEGMDKRWYAHDEALDAEIAERFAGLNHAAAAGECDDWAMAPDSMLALIIVLDQFSRNLYRGSGKAFACDGKALALTHDALEKGWGEDMPERRRQFLYMPLMHSELLPDQMLSVELFGRFEDDNNLKFAIEHKDIIARFGRFPHRNAALGRDSTEEEREFMKEHKGF